MNQNKDQNPYRQYQKLPVWKILSRAVADLVDNGDLEEKTARAYIVGYMCKCLVEAEKPKAKS
jgi:hypothetical protein